MSAEDKSTAFAVKVIQLAQQGDQLQAIQLFQSELNKPPAKSWVSRKNGNDYIPIGIIEALLDGYFLGCWEPHNFYWERIHNEVAGRIDLCVTNPITNITRCLTGAAAVQIRTVGAPEALRADGKELEYRRFKMNWKDNKIITALELDIPSLKSHCITNAAKSLGRRFGRDLNRDKTTDPLVMDMQAGREEEILDNIIND